MRLVASIFLLACSIFGLTTIAACPLLAQTQTKIYSPDFIFYIQHNPNAITSFTCRNPSALATTLHTGDTNAVWDFTSVMWSLTPPTMESDSFMSPKGLPLANDSDFVTSNVVIQTRLSSTAVRDHFFTMDPNGAAYDLGITEVNSGVARKVIAWNPPIEDAHYPMLYQTGWQSTAIEDGDTLAPGEHRVIASSSFVDEWGTLLLPIPYEYSTGALRVKEQQIETLSLNGETESIDTTYIYHYYTLGLFSAKIITNPSGTITEASYTENFDKTASVSADDASTNGLHLAISQNPASSTLTKIFYSVTSDAQSRVELMDMMGRSVRILQNGPASKGQHVLEIDPNSLASGSYFVRLTAEGQSVIERFVIAR